MKVTNLKHESSSVNNIVLNSDGSVGGELATTLASKSDTGTWTSYTPTWTGVTLGNGTVAGSYLLIEPDVVMFFARLNFGSTTSITGTVSFSLPFAQNLAQTGLANVAFLDAGTQQYAGVTIQLAAGADLTSVFRLSSAAGAVAGLSSTQPFTWANNDRIEVVGFYRKA